MNDYEHECHVDKIDRMRDFSTGKTEPDAGREMMEMVSYNDLEPDDFPWVAVDYDGNTWAYASEPERVDVLYSIYTSKDENHHIGKSKHVNQLFKYTSGKYELHSSNTKTA